MAPQTVPRVQGEVVGDVELEGVAVVALMDGSSEGQLESDVLEVPGPDLRKSKNTNSEALIYSLPGPLTAFQRAKLRDLMRNNG